MTANKSYEVKEWFADKIANEVRMNITMCDVFAILKETEKAVYALCSLGCDRRKTTWIPKSALIENEIGEDEIGIYHHETFFINDYEEAVEKFHEHWRDYK